MKRSPLKRKSALATSGRSPLRRNQPIAKKRRSSSDFARIYGSEQRVAWVRTQPCIACLPATLSRSETVHVGTGGIGRKANHDQTVPLCRAHHQELHQLGIASFQARHSIDLWLFAAVTEKRWQSHVGGPAIEQQRANDGGAA